jgi:hypothetical protein
MTLTFFLAEGAKTETGKEASGAGLGMGEALSPSSGAPYTRGTSITQAAEATGPTPEAALQTPSSPAQHFVHF